jgi:hypothetical protein
MKSAPAARPLLLAAALLLAAGCDPRKKLVGTWELATLDGVAPAVATPLRVLFPAAKYGVDTMAARGMWHEVTYDSLVLTLDPGGAYRTRAVEKKRTLARPNAYARPDYVSGAFGGDLIRDSAQALATASAGTWALAGDSLVLTEPRDSAIAELAARIGQALPDADAAAIRRTVADSVPATLPPRWKGALKGERLELIDRDGRRYGFRRAGSAR